jgi:hypothetical protein
MERFPPFIHRQPQPSPLKPDPKHLNNDPAVLPEPLAICSSIMRMCTMRSSRNLAFIWRTIQAEPRRIEDEVSIIF